MQGYKFPVQLPYVVGSLLTVTLLMLCKKRMVVRGRVTAAVCFIGKNAVFMFMSQGVSSSLIYKIVPLIQCHWLLKLVVVYAINCLLAIVIAYLFLLLDNYFHQKLKK